MVANFLASACHNGDGLPFDEFAHGVYATQRQYRVAHGGFNQHSQVTSGRHLQHDTAYGYAQYVFGLILHGKALEGIGRRANRSEEHTSELQSLMRISYAVFCLKKQTKQKQDK